MKIDFLKLKMNLKIKTGLWLRQLWLLNFLLESSTSLKFYSQDESHDYSCSFRFEQPVRIECACVDGFWILHDSCDTENIPIAGDKHHCVRFPEAPTVSRGIQIAKNQDELVVLGPDGGITKLTEEDAQYTVIDGESVVVAGRDWVLVDATGARICLNYMEEENSYCLYSNLEIENWVIQQVVKGCDNGYDYFVDPFKCHSIGKETDDICEHNQIKRRFKRQDDAAAAGPPADGGGAGGGAATGNLTEGAITPDDEDYPQYNRSMDSGNKTEESPVSIASGIMDYMKQKLRKILEGGDSTTTNATNEADGSTNIPDVNSRGGNPLNVTYMNPVYEFLEISKRITQKTCPPHYVKPNFLNLAVATFINMQQVMFKFPEQSFRPSGFRRVLNFLRLCEENAQPFNFSNPDCDGKVEGNYTAFGQPLELTITSEFADYSRDPIVETVWKVFFNAHSYCYPYFNKTLDHHRFATWMIPLFQNEMNVLWAEGNTTNTSLGGLFGNQIEVQGNLGYCAASSRLESQYPWDLPRPSQIAELGGASNKTNSTAPADGGAAAPPPDSRRKREISYDLIGERDDDDDDLIMSTGSCMDSSKPLLCPTHVISIIQQSQE